MSEETTRHLPESDLKLILMRLDSIDAHLKSVDAHLNSVDAHLNNVDAHLNSVDARLDGVDKRLDSMDGRLEKLEARAYDTKPIWERALAEIIEIGKQIDSLDRRFSILTDDVVHMRADVRKMGDRIADLEQPSRA